MHLRRSALRLFCAAGFVALVVAMAHSDGSASEKKVHRYRITVSGMT